MSDYLNKTQINYIANLLHGRIETNEINNSSIRTIINKSDINDFSKVKVQDITSQLKYDFPSEETKTSGITFTPISVVKYMYDDVLSLNLDYITNYKIADLSVGNGAFFIGLIILLKEKDPTLSVVNLIENNLYGYDIMKENIYFAKLNLYLIALYYGENPESINFNLSNVNTLEYFKNKNNVTKFDLIVGNPPYVKQQNINKSHREFLLRNFETIKSNYNLYYAFLELSVELLKENGVSLQLVPNYLLKIKSAKNLREYLLKDQHIKKIVNFNANKIFSGIDTYSMIIELSKANNEIEYKSLPNDTKSLSCLLNTNWKNLPPSNITDDSINLVDNKEEFLIKQVQSQLFTLDISTGIATQKDRLFLIDDTSIVDGKYMTKFFNNRKYLIEKESVVKIYKGSGQAKNNLNFSYIIFPYFLENNSAKIKSIDYLSKNEPNTHNYFLATKKELCERSGINDDDDHWYRYGRTQSLTRFEPKILFPTNSLKPNFNLIEDNALFFNGYAIYGLRGVSLTLDELKALEIILNSDLTEIFILSTSYFIGSGYVSYQKKYMEKFTIPFLNSEVTYKILELYKSKDLHLLNKYIFKLYGLDYYDFIH
ncbi:N-6 DNA methylase [Enterococcus casseliflavus]|nr:N-6 DNA methylase [Enterococcus casseliflavus]